jgi:hypothetical protein
MPSHHFQLQDGLYFCDPHNLHTCKWMNNGKHVMNLIWIIHKLSKNLKMFQHLHNPCHMFCYKKSSTSYSSKTLIPFESCSNLISMLTVGTIYVVSTSNNNQWPLDLFITQGMTTRFKTLVIAFVIFHTSFKEFFVVKTLCLIVHNTKQWPFWHAMPFQTWSFY